MADYHEKPLLPGDWVRLNIGGTLFLTTRHTLTCRHPNGMLARMFQSDSDWGYHRDPDGAILIDRSPRYFEPILNYLRHGKLVIDPGLSSHGVLEEARFYGITELVQCLEDEIKAKEETDKLIVGRVDLVKRLISCATGTELRCQGMDFSGADLSQLDLSHINFKFAKFRHTNLSMCNLTRCNLERADMTDAILDGAKLTGAVMLCAVMENASLQNSDFEDPSNQLGRANMEGANMKHVNLEGSRMAGANLRVANLKHASLKNCDLRSAVLAGADLEFADLSGCDLTEANLRGANIKDASFALLLHPIHMARVMTGHGCQN